MSTSASHRIVFVGSVKLEMVTGVTMRPMRHPIADLPLLVMLSVGGQRQDRAVLTLACAGLWGLTLVLQVGTNCVAQLIGFTAPAATDRVTSLEQTRMG